ncbi:MAG TPA: hypothetical protein VHD63_11650 [Ktedonobacteraceae bacterium]|nr:hypothetical protein [Ktedonobacteraceae bacterium]
MTQATTLSSTQDYAFHAARSLAPQMLRRRFALFVLCTLAFLTCLLLTVTPLVRMPDTLLRLRMAGRGQFVVAS